VRAGRERLTATSLPPRAIPVCTASAHSAYRSAGIRDGG